MSNPGASRSSVARSRRAPTVFAGATCLLAYVAIFYCIAQASGIPYADWFATAENATRSALLPLLAGIVLLVAFLLVFRWNGLWRDPVRLPTNRLHAVLMILFLGTILLRLVFVRWAEVPGDLLLVIAAVGVGVGFAEEMALRGIFLRAMRTDGRSEGRAVLWTCIAFGLLHIPNMFLGTGLLGIAQLFMAAFSGFVLYLFRRRFAWIVPAMVAHGAWDISTFLSTNYLSETMAQVSIVLTLLIQVLALVALVQFAIREREPVHLDAQG